MSTWKLSPNIQETIENIKAAKKYIYIKNHPRVSGRSATSKKTEWKSAPSLHELKLHSAGAALLPMQKSKNAFEKVDPYFN